MDDKQRILGRIPGVNTRYDEWSTAYDNAIQIVERLKQFGFEAHGYENSKYPVGYNAYSNKFHSWIRNDYGEHFEICVSPNGDIYKDQYNIANNLQDALDTFVKPDDFSVMDEIYQDFRKDCGRGSAESRYVSRPNQNSVRFTYDCNLNCTAGSYCYLESCTATLKNGTLSLYLECGDLTYYVYGKAKHTKKGGTKTVKIKLPQMYLMSTIVKLIRSAMCNARHNFKNDLIQREKSESRLRIRIH